MPLSCGICLEERERNPQEAQGRYYLVNDRHCRRRSHWSRRSWQDTLIKLLDGEYATLMQPAWSIQGELGRREDEGRLTSKDKNKKEYHVTHRDRCDAGPKAPA